MPRRKERFCVKVASSGKSSSFGHDIKCDGPKMRCNMVMIFFAKLFSASGAEVPATVLLPTLFNRKEFYPWHDSGQIDGIHALMIILAKMQHDTT